MGDDFLFDDSFEDAPIWARALDVQLDLGRWFESGFGKRWALSFGDSYLEGNLHRFAAEHPELGEVQSVERTAEGLQVHFSGGLTKAEITALFDRYPEVMQSTYAYTDLAKLVRENLYGAHTYYVTEEIADLILATADAFPDDFEVAREMLPADVGFIYVPSGIITRDVNGNDFVVKGYLWDSHPDANGWDICTFTDADDPRETGWEIDALRKRGLVETEPPLWLFDAQGSPFGPIFGREVTPNKPWKDGMPNLEESGWHAKRMFRFMVAFWGFVNQEVAIPARLSRGVRRRAQAKLMLPPDELTVRVVRLRKINYLQPDGHVVVSRTIEWSHRWYVEGHKRRAHTRTYHRGTPKEFTISVAEAKVPGYLKGPEHAPIIERDNVHVVHR